MVDFSLSLSLSTLSFNYNGRKTPSVLLVSSTCGFEGTDAIIPLSLIVKSYERSHNYFCFGIFAELFSPQITSGVGMPQH